MLLQPLAIGLTDAVEYDRDGHNGKAVENALCEILVGNGLQHIEPKALHANHRCDHNHAQRHHDGLIDACHDGGHSQWHLHFPKFLPP